MWVLTPAECVEDRLYTVHSCRVFVRNQFCPERTFFQDASSETCSPGGGGESTDGGGERTDGGGESTAGVGRGLRGGGEY